MELIRKITYIFRQILRGNFYGARRFSTLLIYGLTHRRCRRCHRVKGFTTSPNCYTCMAYNLYLAIFAEDEDADADKEETRSQ